MWNDPSVDTAPGFQGATRHGDSVVHFPIAAVAHAFVLSG